MQRTSKFIQMLATTAVGAVATAALLLSPATQAQTASKDADTKPATQKAAKTGTKPKAKSEPGLWDKTKAVAGQAADATSDAASSAASAVRKTGKAIDKKVPRTKDNTKAKPAVNADGTPKSSP